MVCDFLLLPFPFQALTKSDGGTGKYRIAILALHWGGVCVCVAQERDPGLTC